MPMNDADKHISLSFWASNSLLYLHQLLTMQSFLRKLMGFYDNQSHSHKNSQLLDKPYLLGVRVTAATFVSKTSLVNCITNHTGKWKIGTRCLFIPAVCHAQHMSYHTHFNNFSLVFMILDFWTYNFQAVSTFLVWFLWEFTIGSRHVRVLQGQIIYIQSFVWAVSKLWSIWKYTYPAIIPNPGLYSLTSKWK